MSRVMQGDAAVGLRPRPLHLRHSMLRVLDAQDACMHECLELEGVEMPPLSLGSMVVAGQLTATLRTRPTAAVRMIDVDRG